VIQGASPRDMKGRVMEVRYIEVVRGYCGGNQLVV